MADQIKIDVIFEPTKIDRSMQPVEQGAKKAGQRASVQFSKGFSDSLKSSLSGVRNQIVDTVGAFFAFNTVKNVLVGSTRAAAEFEQAVREVNTILPQNTKLTEQQTKQLRELSKQFGTSATSQVKSFYQVVSAGIQNTTRQTKLLSDANKLAIGGLTSTNAAIDILTSTLNAYGQSNITSKDAADSLFTAVRLGKTTVDELASSLGTVLPGARAAGQSFDVVNAAIATLTTTGGTTSEAVTRLNALFTAFARNGEKLGKGMDITALQTDGLVKVLQRLEQRTGGSSDKLFALLGRSEAVIAAQNLMRNGAEGLAGALGEMAQKGGAANDAFNKMATTSAQQFKALDANLNDLSITFGEKLLPFLNKTIRGFTGLLNLMGERREPTAIELVNQKISEQRKLLNQNIDTLQKLKESQKDDGSFLSIFNRATNAQIAKQTELVNKQRSEIAELVKERARLSGQNRSGEIEQLRAAQGEYDAYLMKLEQERLLKQAAITQDIIMQATRNALLEQQRQQTLTAQQVFVEQSQSQFASMVDFFGLGGDRITQIAKEISSVTFSALSGGVSRAFENVGKALAEGKDAFTAFKDSLKSILADVASAIGDTFIKWGIANLVSGNIGMGSAQIAAGGALKILAGSLGSSGGGGTGGGTAPTGSMTDPITVDDSGINSLQDTRQAQEQVQLSLNVEGSLVRESELNGYVTNLLEQGASEDANIIPSLKTGFA